MGNAKGAITGFQWFIAIVLGIVILFVLLYLFGNIKSGASQKIDEFKCAESIDIATRSNKFTDEVFAKCPAEYHKKIDNSLSNQKNVKKLISENIDWCWFNFKMGEKELFEHLDGNFCKVCDVFEFSKETPIADFGTYLVESEIPNTIKLKAGNKTHIEFLQRVKMDAGEITKFKEKPFDGVIDPKVSKRYAVVFVYSKDASALANHYLLRKAVENDYYLGFAYYGTALVAGKAIGADWDARVMLIPYNEEELGSLCEILE